MAREYERIAEGFGASQERDVDAYLAAAWPELSARLRANEERSGKSPARDESHLLDVHEDRDGDEGGDGELLVERQERDRVSLIQRAQPLIHLMEWTVKEKGFILWEASGDF